MSKLFSVRSFPGSGDGQYDLSGTSILSWLRSNWFGSPGSNISVQQAMRIGAVYRCVQILSQSVGGLPLKVFRTGDYSPVVTSIATKNSNVPYTQVELWSIVTSHLATRGNAYVRKMRSAGGQILGLVPIHPDNIRVEKVQIGSTQTTKKFTLVDTNEPLTNYDVMHVMIMSDDGVVGRGPLEYARSAAAIALSAEEAAANMYDSGLLINGVLSTDLPLDKNQSEMLKERWRVKTAGKDHAGETAVLSHGLKFQQLSMNPADAQFLESRKFQREDIAGLFGLQPWMIGESERSTGQGPGNSAQFTTMVKLTLKGYADVIGQRISMEILPSDQDCRFDLADFSRGDATERAAYYAQMITSGLLVPDEARAMEGWGPRPDGKGMELHLPNNVSANNPLQDGGSADSKKEPSDPGGEDDK